MVWEGGTSTWKFDFLGMFFSGTLIDSIVRKEIADEDSKKKNHINNGADDSFAGFISHGNLCQECRRRPDGG
jgi:hypothetical protein